jgi:hypothetical protein
LFTIGGEYERRFTSRLGVSATFADEAKARGWTVASMKDDWRSIFPERAK